VVALSAVLLDFDGTACPQDVSEALLETFGESGWRALDEAVARGEIGIRECADRQAAMLQGSRDEMLAFALERFSVDPTLPTFVDWARAAGLTVQVVSDGFGFHVRPILEAAGLGSLDVLTNELDGRGLRHPAGHPTCLGCGTCKMLAAVLLRERHGAVAFVGDGISDRYGALYSDLVFAKGTLTQICHRDGVPFIEWRTFDDVRAGIESMPVAPAAVAPPTCPGWKTD
jgi:2,3-diketo-5-methylthio-1-phosphopentane phosphatase